MAKISQKIVKLLIRETVAEISDESNGEETCFYGYGSYSYYHIDYTARILTEIEKLSD